MPEYLILSIESLYLNDRFILTDGPKSSGEVHPTRGVKQGCPLSPLLFSLIINDFKPSFAPNGSRLGVQLNDQPDSYLSHLFYADDLTLFANSPAQLNLLLKDLEVYAREKGLTINVQKSQVCVFNATVRHPPTGQFLYGSSPLSIVDKFKYLGLIFNNEGCSVSAESQWSQNLLIATNSASTIAKKLGVSNRFDLVLSLF